MAPQRKLGWFLLFAGAAGVFSLLSMPVEQLVTSDASLSPLLLRSLTLVQPAVLLTVAVLVGSRWHRCVGLEAPALRALAEGTSPLPWLEKQLIPALWVGLCVGVMIAFYNQRVEGIVRDLAPENLSHLRSLTPPLVTRLLYGGITEEIMMRWGLMTGLAWVGWRLLARPQKLPATVYLVAIGTSAVAFAAAHLPMLYGLILQPPVELVYWSLAANALAGIGFGVLFWRQGLEAAIIAHMFAHVMGWTLA